MIQKLFLGLVIVVAAGVVGLSLIKIPAPSSQVHQSIDADKVLKTS